MHDFWTDLYRHPSLYSRIVKVTWRVCNHLNVCFLFWYAIINSFILNDMYTYTYNVQCTCKVNVCLCLQRNMVIRQIQKYTRILDKKTIISNLLLQSFSIPPALNKISFSVLMLAETIRICSSLFNRSHIVSRRLNSIYYV